MNSHGAHGEAQGDALHHVKNHEEEDVAQLVADAGALRGEGVRGERRRRGDHEGMLARRTCGRPELVPDVVISTLRRQKTSAQGLR